MKIWKTSDIKFLQKHLHLFDREIGELMGVNSSTIAAARKRFGLMKGKEAGRFKSGITVWNKGINYDAGGRSHETRFKKGVQQGKVRAIGEVFIIPDGTGKQYGFIKLIHHRQYPYARHLYERAHNVKLKSSEIIRFKDGNTLNFKIENLIKISRTENLILNRNRKKAGESLKKTWMIAKTFNDYGYKKSWFIKKAS